MPIPVPCNRIIAAAAFFGLSGSVIAANQIIDDSLPVELVTISIHMPDGRVIETKGQRFPSRSRIHIKTGQIPAFKSVVQPPSDSSSPESTVTDLAGEEELESDATIEDAIEQSAELDLILESDSEPAPNDSAPGDQSESNGTIRAFKKTVKS